MELTKTPTTLQSAIVYFSDEENCIKLLIARRWPNGMVCPRCSSDRVTRRGGRAVWLCNGCRKEFTLKVGTFMEDSPINLGKWLTAMWLVTNCKNGVSSYEIHRAIGVTQKSAWFMLHRIRLSFGDVQHTDMSGTVEVDESYLGGIDKNRHASKRIAGSQGRSGIGKSVVMGLLERGDASKASRARSVKIGTPTAKILRGEIAEHVKPGAELYTDGFAGYKNLPAEYVHEFVDHAVEYVRENVHTNSLENFFSLLKRMIKGTYVSIDPVHLQSYLDEQTFRFNERKETDGMRFETTLEGIYHKRITYKELTARPCSWLRA